MKESKFYTFDQNNSGGYFVEDDEFGVCETIIVEAYNADNARERLDQIGRNVDGFDDYCPCCGERWFDACESDGKTEPMIYDTPIAKYIGSYFRKRAFVHYLSGEFKEFNFKEQK